jgi:mgtE-like transporter
MAEVRARVTSTRLARRARRLFGYWRSESRTLRQGLVALMLSTMAGFAAGLTLARFDHALRELPGLLVLIPASVGMRGMIFGAMGARLGTQVAAGLYEPNLRRRGPLRTNVEVAVVSALVMSLYLAVAAKLVASAFGEDTVSLWDLVTVSVLGGTAASGVLLVVTVGLSVLSFRRGWDLDAVSVPMVTAVGDMVTLPFLFLAAAFTRSQELNAVLAGLCTAAGIAALAYAIARASAPAKRILLETGAVIAIAPLLDIFAGALLEAHRAELAAVPGILILIPPFVSQAGALGGILSSRLSSKLQVGVLSPKGRPQVPALVDGSIIVTLALAVFTSIGAAATVLATATGQARPPATTMVGGALLSGLLVLPVILVAGYYVAVASTRLHLDPDNHGVPILTALLDLSGVSAILFVMAISGVI